MKWSYRLESLDYFYDSFIGYLIRPIKNWHQFDFHDMAHPYKGSSRLFKQIRGLRLWIKFIIPFSVIFSHLRELKSYIIVKKVYIEKSKLKLFNKVRCLRLWVSSRIPLSLNLEHLRELKKMFKIKIKKLTRQNTISKFEVILDCWYSRLVLLYHY